MGIFLSKIIACVNAFVKVDKSIKEEEVVLPAYTVCNLYKRPKNFDSLSSNVQAAFEELINKVVSLPERKIFSFRRVFVSWQGIVFKNLSAFVPSMMAPTLADDFRARYLFRQWFGQKRLLHKGLFALVFDQWSAVNYFHWVIEALPRLMLIKQYYPQATLLITDSVSTYVYDTIEVFGFREVEMIRSNEIVFTDSLLFPERTGSYWLQDISLIQKTREQIKLFYNLQNTIPYRKIYVSRAKARIRRLLNESAIHKMLIEYGFEIVFFEEMTFKEQVALAAEAKVMVGLHGANLTNILFMASGTKVVELVNEENINLAYFKLATYCALDYYCLPCQNADTASNNDAHVSVRTEVFAELLASLN